MLRIALLAVPTALGDRLASALAARGAAVTRLPPAGDSSEPPGGGASAADSSPVRPQTVVYLPRRDRAPDAEALQAELVALPAARRTVVVASSDVYPPHHHHPGFAAESWPALRPDRNRVSAGWADFERRVEEHLGPTTRLALLRAAHTPCAGGDDPWSRRLSGRLAATLPGHDPSIQLLALADLAAAVVRAAEGVATGTFNAVPAGTVPLRKALRLAGVRRLALPGWLLRLVRTLAGDGAAAADRLRWLRYPATADGGEACRELGFRARHGSARAVLDLASELGRGGATVRATALDESAPAAPGGTVRVDAGDGWEPRFDDFGMDPHYIGAFGRTLFRFLHDHYWRVEHRGLEHLPRRGRAVLAGVHRGFMPWDGVMALHLLVRETGRYPRFLLHPTLLKFPFLFNYMTKLGGIPACRENADRVLARDGVLAIYPEGIRGAFTPYRRAYRLGRFGRHDYVRMALANRAPIVPFVTVGSAEIYPILGRVDWGWWKRFSEWPYLPITPTFPGPPGLPLPSKWHTRYLEPLHVEEEYPPEAAEDRAVVHQLSRRVRRRMQAAIDGMLERRRSIWWGSVFDDEDAAEETRHATARRETSESRPARTAPGDASSPPQPGRVR